MHEQEQSPSSPSSITAEGGGCVAVSVTCSSKGLSVFSGLPPTRKRHSASSIPDNAAYCLITSVIGVPAWTFMRRTSPVSLSVARIV